MLRSTPHRAVRVLCARTFICTAILALLATRAHTQPVPHEVGLLPGDVSVAPAGTHQIGSHAARGGNQVLVVWTDNRGTSTGSEQSGMDILGIRLSPTGEPIDVVPFVICKNAGWQQAPQATWNGTNWLVTFYSQDPTQFYYQNNIRGVRVSSAGEVLDPTPLLLVDNEQYVWVSGQAGEWLVTWYKPHSDGYGTYLVGRRLGGDGQFLDAGPVTLMDWTFLSNANRVLAAGGEYLVIGQDWYSYGYKARRVGIDGQPIGNVYIPIGPDIGSNGTQYLASWIVSGANYQLRCSLMSADGVLANPAGALIYSGAFVPTDVSISHDGTSWFVGWATNQKRAARVDAAGHVLDPGGVLVPVGTPPTQSTYNFLVVGNASGGAVATYSDYRTDSDANVFCIPLSAGNVPGSESTVSTGTPNQRAPAFAEGPNGQIALAFISETTGDDRILVHFLSDAGQPTTAEPIIVAQGPALAKPGIAWNGLAYMITWNATSVNARRMRPDGTFIDAVPIDVMPGFNADVAALGQNFCVIASKVETNPQYIDVYYRRVDGVTGGLLDDSPVLAGMSYSYNARIHADGTRWIATWERHPTHDDPQSSVQYTFINSDGSHTPEGSVNSAFTSSGGQPDVAISSNRLLFVWRSNSLANANNYIRGRLMNWDGSWATDLFTIAEAPGRQLRPVVGWDNTNFLVTWEDQRNQVAFFDARTDIYAARVSESGVVLDPAAFPIIAGPDAETTAAILSRTTGVSYVASARFVPSADLPSYRLGLTLVELLRTAVDDAAAPFEAPVLYPGRPNPFRGAMEVRFALERPSHVSLAIYETAGRRVRTLASGPETVGSHVATWDGSDDRGRRVPAGVYFIRLDAGGRVATRKISLLR